MRMEDLKFFTYESDVFYEFINESVNDGLEQLVILSVRYDTNVKGVKMQEQKKTNYENLHGYVHWVPLQKILE